MPVTIKAANVKYKSPETGQYVGVNSVSDNTTAEQIALIQEVGAQQIEDVQGEVDGIIEAAEAAYNGIEAQKNTMIASIASIAGMGTDTTMTQSGVAADAESVGDIKKATDVLSYSFDEISGTFESGYVNQSGENASSEAWERTGYIKLSGEYILFSSPCSENQTQLDNVAAVAFFKYMNTSSFISAVPITNGTYGNTKNKIVKIPDDAMYAKFSRAVNTDHSALAFFNLNEQVRAGLANNILPIAGFRSGEYVSNGITFTTNDDLSVEITGTATDNAYYNIVVTSDHYTIEPGDYCLSGCEGGSSSTYYLHMTVGEKQYTQLSDERIIRVSQQSEYLLAIRVMSGTVMDHVLIKPMLEKGNIKHEYFPSKYANKALYDGLANLSAENMIPFPYYYKYPYHYSRGITFTINADGSVTMNGTATGDAYYMFVSRNQGMELPAGRYTLSGCHGGSSETYSLRLYVQGVGTGMICTDAPVTRQYNGQGVYRVFIYVNEGTTVENVTIKPMLETGPVAHNFKPPKGIIDVVSIGGEKTDKIKNAVRIFHQPWIAMRDLDYYSKQGKTSEDSEYIGVPYASVFPIGGDVLYQRNMATFFSAVKNPASIVYQELMLVNGNKVQSNYGAVCTSFTGWINGMPMQVNAHELPDFGFERYEYQGMDSVAIGDCLLSVETQHCIQIYDISVDATTYKPLYVHLTDHSGSGARTMKRTVEEFESMLIENGGAFELGKYPNQQIINIEKLTYATDIIPDMGDRTYYYTGDTVEVYIADDTVETIYIKKGSGAFAQVSLAGLPNRELNDVTVYDITGELDGVGEYTITTDIGNYTKCVIRVINTGSISINGNAVVLTGYSQNIQPVWVQIFGLQQGEPGIYPSPEGYAAVGYDKFLIDSDTFSISLPPQEDYDGYYIRVNYETGFGQAFKASEYHMY